MKIEELRNADFRTFNSNDNQIEILFPENHEGLVFPIIFDNEKETLTFYDESISFDKIKEIKISFCYNKVGFKNIPCYKLHVDLNNETVHFRRYIGLFEYTENNEFLNKLPKNSNSLIKEYKLFNEYIENKNKQEEIEKEDVNIQYARFHLIDIIIKKFIKK